MIQASPAGPILSLRQKEEEVNLSENCPKLHAKGFPLSQGTFERGAKHVWLHLNFAHFKQCICMHIQNMLDKFHSLCPAGVIVLHSFTFVSDSIGPCSFHASHDRSHETPGQDPSESWRK